MLPQHLAILAAARDAWHDAAPLRLRRDRYKRYTYGDQWSDTVTDPATGRSCREYDLIVQSGHKPLINNLIRPIVKTVVGRYRTLVADGTAARPDPSGLSSPSSSLLELDCRMLEEFLISGCAIQRVARETRLGATGLHVDNVDPRRFFVNPFRDPRGSDITLIGMLHDLTLPDIISRFAGGSPRRAAFISRTYAALSSDAAIASRALLGQADPDGTDFFTPPPGLCRAIEVWTLDCRRRSPKKTKTSSPPPLLSFEWRVRWYAPDGTLLAASDSPSGHRSHPFALRFYPLTDGEVHSFVEDVIDQQRCINRMIVLADRIIGSAAKGVLLFPADQKPKNVDWNDIASAWATSTGIIPITGHGAHLPQQVNSAPGDCGAYQLLAMQMKLFDNISGVGDILAGRTVAPSTGSAVYESQLRNSTIALADILDSFAAFRRDRDHLITNA